MTEQYSASIQPGVLAIVKEEIEKKEEQQKKHYYYLSELQKMAAEIPGKFQQRLPYDLLSSLASSLLDNTVFDIVNSLKEVQTLEERNLSSQRIKLLNEHKQAKADVQKKYREDLQKCQSRPHNIPFVESQYLKDKEAIAQRSEEEIKRKDMKVILELDQKVMDQQVLLEKSGVPGFYVTNNPQEIRLQMYLLDFIQRICQQGTFDS